MTRAKTIFQSDLSPLVRSETSKAAYPWIRYSAISALRETNGFMPQDHDSGLEPSRFRWFPCPIRKDSLEMVPNLSLALHNVQILEVKLRESHGLAA